MRRVFPAVLSEPFQDGGELCSPFLDLVSLLGGLLP
jgi:hypothetical protein